MSLIYVTEKTCTRTFYSLRQSETNHSLTFTGFKCCIYSNLVNTHPLHLLYGFVNKLEPSYSLAKYINT